MDWDYGMKWNGDELDGFIARVIALQLATGMLSIYIYEENPFYIKSML